MTDARTPFYEGDTVAYVGAAMPPAHGKLLAFASSSAGHVRWASGAHVGQVEIVDLYDLMPVESSVAIAQVDPMGHTAVKRAMALEGEEGVLSFLASSEQLTGWEKIAAETLQFVADRLRVDASMGMVYEQLNGAEVDAVVSLGARVLLRDAFGEVEEEAS